MLNINVIKSRLTSLESANKPNRSDKIWKPAPGRSYVRIVPYAHNLENPFIELKFHFQMNGKTYLSPDSFNRPDPIVEFSNKMKKSGDKEEWKLGKKLEPKLRTYVPILIRGREEEGVKFWGFGKQVYQQLLSIIADPDYGDITELANGRDVVIEFKAAESGGNSFPETTIRMRPSTSPAVEPSRKDLLEKIKNQTNILDLFPELSYEDLKGVMEAWLHPEDGDEPITTHTEGPDGDSDPPTVKKLSALDDKSETPTIPAKNPRSPTAIAAKVEKEVGDEAFDKLFNTK